MDSRLAATEIRPLRGSEAWEAAVRGLTEAFTEDPCLAWLLDSTDYDPAKARHIHAYTMRVASLWGRTWIAGPDAEGVCLWLPPGRVEVSTPMFIRAGGLALRKTVGKGILGRLDEYGKYSSAFHHRIARGPHFYLLSIGVARAGRGRGLAKALILPMLGEFDSRGLPCYLETHNPANVGFYEKFGFRLAGTGRLPRSDTTHFAMLREPRA